MVAMMILIVGMIGLLTSVNVAMEANLRSQLREEGVNMGERVLNELRNRGFDNISATYLPTTLPSRMRGATRQYAVQKSSTVLSTDANGLPLTKELAVVITWDYKGTTYENRVSAPISILR
jgi:type IV pilus assembly protein PilV